MSRCIAFLTINKAGAALSWRQASLPGAGSPARLLFLSLLIGVSSPAAWAQAWKAPPETLKLDFRAASPERRILFLDDGVAVELACRFLHLGRPKIRIEAILPEAGEFKIAQANTAAQVECKVTEVRDRRAVVEVTSKRTAMSEDDVKRQIGRAVEPVWGPAENEIRSRAEKLSKGELRRYLTDNGIPLPRVKKDEDDLPKLRQAYVRAEVIVKIEPQVRDQLAELADRRPTWVTAVDRAGWKRMRAQELYDLWQELLGWEAKDAYLRRCELPTEANRANLRARLGSRFTAVYQALSGKAGSGDGDAAAITRGLTVEEQEQLRASVDVDLRLRFYAKADPKDSNGQWFQGQRVGCKARGVASIRLEGRLDPANHDTADWWILEGFEPEALHIEAQRNPLFRIDSTPVEGKEARVRVAATGKEAVDYAIEFRPVKAVPQGLKVVVRERGNLLERKFPF